MSDAPDDISALTQALQLFTRSTDKLESAYRLLETRVQELDRELADKNRELALTTEYLSNLLESMDEGVVAVGTEGRITRFNRAAAQILGYAGEEIVGRSFVEVFARDFAAPTHAMGTGLRAKSGRIVPLRERDSVISDRPGRALGHVKTFQDLSEVTALREQVRQMDRLAAIGEMAATVAHEIRNPLGGIRGFAALLARDIPIEDPRRRLVDKIVQGAISLERVVNELLEYTRPIDLRLRPVPCRGLVEAAVSFLDVDTEKFRLLNHVPDGLNLLADADKVRQVLLNVLLNAVQSMDTGGEVHIDGSYSEEHARITVRDAGIGMNQEQLASMFSPFFTTKERGTGLGLAVSRKIVEGHGGQITAESAPGAGTVIAILLPRAEQPGESPKFAPDKIN